MNFVTERLALTFSKKCLFNGIMQRTSRVSSYSSCFSTQTNSDASSIRADEDSTATNHKDNNINEENILTELIMDVNVDGEVIKVDRRSKFAFYLDRDVKKELEVRKYSIRKHPGSRKLDPSLLPQPLLYATQQVLEDEPVKELEIEAQTMRHRIYQYHRPLEESDRREKMKDILEEIINKENIDPDHPAIMNVDRQVLLHQRNDIFQSRIRANLQQFRTVEFSTRRRCLTYMLARLCPDYASLVKALSHAKLALPHFEPTTMLDFGSGVGSATWAVDKVWPRRCMETVSVDISAEMNNLNELLLKGGNLDAKFRRRPQSTYFRQFLPASGSVKHDLVVSSRSLFELQSRQMRLRTLEILWKTVQPGGCLVLVEAGHHRACELLLEARQFLLEGLSQSSSGIKAKVVAPCPHQMRCPLLLKKEKYRICSDSTRYLDFNKFGPYLLSDTFSYLVFQKINDKESIEDTSKGGEKCWPRIVQPVLKGSHITVRVCNQYGNLQELVACKKHGVLGKSVARVSNLGDKLPVHLLPPEFHISPDLKIFPMWHLAKEKEKAQKLSSDESSCSSQPSSNVVDDNAQG